MNRLTPSTILLVAIAILLGSLLLLQKTNKDLILEQKRYIQYKEISSQYTALQTSWGKLTKADKKIDKIIKIVGIQNLTKELKNKKIYVEFKSKSLSKIDKFVNKILNTNLKISQLKISKDSVSMEVGI